jgi:hypothetical protein
VVEGDQLTAHFLLPHSVHRHAQRLDLVQDTTRVLYFKQQAAHIRIRIPPPPNRAFPVFEAGESREGRACHEVQIAVYIYSIFATSTLRRRSESEQEALADDMFLRLYSAGNQRNSARATGPHPL